MFNIKEISTRFFSCFPGKSQREIADLFEISRSTVSQWAIGVRRIPWDKLKKLVDSQQISWDWLLEGQDPKTRPIRLDTTEMEGEVFDTPGINQRFLSLFPGMTQQELADYFNVTQSAISSWKTFAKQVPWDKLKITVERKKISWEWLLEGAEPKEKF